jgi:hypothetical protein
VFEGTGGLPVALRVPELCEGLWAPLLPASPYPDHYEESPTATLP